MYSGVYLRTFYIRVVEMVGVGWEVGIVFVKSEYDVIFDTKMLSNVITIRQ